MGPDVIIPVVLIAVVVPAVFVWAKHRFKDAHPATTSDDVAVPGDRLTSNALRELESPPWRVVYEIPPGKLGGIAHVLIGPPGVFAVRTSMDPLPGAPDEPPDPKAIGQAAIERGDLDDALRRCALSSDRLLVVHWGIVDRDEPAVETVPGVTVVDGRRIPDWATRLDVDVLTPSQVDHAWQTILTAIGRPDPLD